MVIIILRLFHSSPFLVIIPLIGDKSCVKTIQSTFSEKDNITIGYLSFNPLSPKSVLSLKYRSH